MYQLSIPAWKLCAPGFRAGMYLLLFSESELCFQFSRFAPLHRGNAKVFHSLDMTDLLLLSCEFLSALRPHYPTRRGPEVSSGLFALLSPLK